MLNLLFISDSPKAEYVKGVLQPMLKVMIDVMVDFDHGLKDVFEKRPAVVCIQDQIDGVTGESVARHIQLLLGNSAPAFILLHAGNGKARAIKGLYEHLIDLSQPNGTVADSVTKTLKALLGDQWEKIYIPPQQSADSVRSSVAVPEELRAEADKFVDELLSDLETSRVSAVKVAPPAASAPDPFIGALSVVVPPELQPEPDDGAAADEPEMVQSTSDKVLELLLEEANKAGRNKVNVPVLSAAAVASDVTASHSPQPVTVAVKPLLPAAAAPSAAPEIPPAGIPLAVPAVAASENKESPTASASQATRVAEFRISQKTPGQEQIPEDLLLAFAENYRSESRFLRNSVTIAFICIVCIAGGWYLFAQKPQTARALKQQLLPAKQAPVPKPASVEGQIPVPASVPQAAVTPSLPIFVPKDGRDASYPAKNPGWERYVGKQAEFRVFSDSGRIQAVQVLAAKDAAVSEVLIASVLQELTGRSEFRIISRSMKAGVRIERGTIQDKGEIIVYRKSGTVKGLVVSVK